MYRVPWLALAPALSVLIVATAATAAFSGRNGKIVFQTNRDGDAEIYTMGADGSNRTNLTRNGAADATPRWSADGRRIVFVSNRITATNADGNDEIFTMSDGGENVRQLTVTTGVNNRWPSWIADGRILFQRVTPGSPRDVFLTDEDGTETNLTPDSVDSAWAAAAARGPWIAFSRYSPAAGQHLYTVNTITRVMKPLLPGTPDAAQFDFQVNWSPGGNDLVFVRSGPSATDLYIAHKDGTGLRQLTSTPTRDESQPAFSPDGKKVVFHACANTGSPNRHCANYVVNVDGTHETEITLLPQAGFLDTFSGDQLNQFWIPLIKGSGPTIEQTNGELRVTLPAGTSFGPEGYANASAFMACRFPGDFDMQIDYRLLSGLLPTDGINLGFDATEFTIDSYSGQHGMFVHNAGGNNHGISTNFPDPGVYQPPYNDFIQDTALAGTLRLARTTPAPGIATVTASRLSGLPWSFTSLSYTAPTSQAANLNVFTNLTPFPTEVKVAYDNFRINSGAVTCPYWDDSAPDWQATER